MAHPAHEVAVRRGHRPLPLGQDPHISAQAGSAGGGADHRPGVHEDLQETLLHGLPVDFLGGRDDDQPDEGGPLLSLQDLAATRRSSSRPLVQDPMTAWSMGTFPTALMGFTFEGRWGKAT